MHRQRVSPFFAVVLAALPLLAAFAPHASAADQRVRVRGNVVNLNGQTLSVKTREGESVDVGLAQGWTVSSVARASIADIKPGDFVGIASLPKDGGGEGALEVLIFPPALKGTNEGSFGWDLKPNSTMTNATVANAVKEVDGAALTVTYHGTDKKITIPEGTPIVTFAPASLADLKPGAVVFIPGEKSEAGAISTHRVVVGTNGVVPPM